MRWVVHSLFMLLSLAFIFPLALIFSISFSSEQSLMTHGYLLIPKQFSLQAYELILKNPLQLLRAYGVTVLVTAAGALSGLLFTTMLAFAISRKDYRYRRATTLFAVIPMLFSGGLVPYYILITQYLHLKDNFLVLILPYLINPFYVLIMKGFLDKLPHEIFESAKIDGSSELRTFFRIVLPISSPALATIGLFLAFNYWNDWWLGLLFIDNQHLVPLQFLLYRIMNTIEFLSNNMDRSTLQIDMSQFPTLSARMAMVVLAAGPMMFIFPLFQRYFISGLTVGSVKN